MSTNKRKNEDEEASTEKRLALDTEQLEESIKQEEESKTAPAIGKLEKDDDEIPSYGGKDSDQEDDDNEEEEEGKDDKEDDKEEDEKDSSENDKEESSKDDESTEANASSQTVESEHREEEAHREKDDPTFVSFRMYCSVKDAGSIVGKKGEKVNHIRDKANVKLLISDNIKGVPERIVTVRGSAENVAKAFGLVVRAIVDEPEDEASTLSSKSYDLRLLVPHPMVGFIIGKSGSNFREIEENSAAKLKAAEQPLPYSTDRILVVNGVSDSIHIAVYYISQTWLEHSEVLKKNKVVFYNPANYDPNLNPQSTLIGDVAKSPLNALNTLSSLSSLSQGQPPMGQQMGQPPMGQQMGQSPMGQHMVQPPMGQPPMGQPPMGQPPMGQPPMGQPPMGQPPMGQPPMGQSPNNALSALNNLSNMMSPNTYNQPYNNYGNNNYGNYGGNYNNNNGYGNNNYNGNYGQGGPGGPGGPGMNQGMGGQQPPSNYNARGMMFQPPSNYNQRAPPPPAAAAPVLQPYTDEHGNTMVGEVVTMPPMQVGGDKYNQDVFVANHSIGSVIGRGGNNIKQIRESSGCTYVKIEPDNGQTMMLGGGRGMVNMRKLTLTGSINSMNTAVYLINQRINTDKRH